MITTSLLSEWLPLIPVRPLIQAAAIAVGLLLILRLQAALGRIERATAMPQTLRAEVMTLHRQVEDLRAKVAEARMAERTPADPTAALAVYRNL